ncbi:MAG: hypothetical protein M1840_009156 [Geoglossum simile]|nr:MAG: hypothetical protein M1840_009156 [Geoglossum simile]
MRSVSSSQFLYLDFEFVCTLGVGTFIPTGVNALIPTGANTLIPAVALHIDSETGGPVSGLSIEDIPSPNSFVDGVVSAASIRTASALGPLAGEAISQVTAAGDIAEGNANSLDTLIACPLDVGTVVRIVVYPNIPLTRGGNPQIILDVSVRTIFGFARAVIRERLGLQPSINLRLFHRGVGFSQGLERLECWQFFIPQELGTGPLVLVFSYDLGDDGVEDPSL